MAMAAIHLLPPLTLVALLHKQLVNVMSAGAVKG
jgi:multiple sugar transport system permease protein